MSKENSPTVALEQQFLNLKVMVAELQQAVMTLTGLLDDRLIKMPSDIKTCPVYFVIEDSPAWEAVKRIAARDEMRPGTVHPIKRSEFESFKTDIIGVRLVEEDSDKNR